MPIEVWPRLVARQARSACSLCRTSRHKGMQPLCLETTHRAAETRTSHYVCIYSYSSNKSRPDRGYRGEHTPQTRQPHRILLYMWRAASPSLRPRPTMAKACTKERCKIPIINPLPLRMSQTNFHPLSFFACPLFYDAGMVYEGI